jgi:tight adherence protein C
MGWPGNTSESAWLLYRSLMAATFSLGTLVTLVVFSWLGFGLDFLQGLGVVLLLGAIGWVRPTASLRQNEARERQIAVRGFPAFLDGLALSVQSGQSFSQAMVAAVSRMPRGSSKRQPSRWVGLMAEAVTRLQARQPRAEVFQMLCAQLPIPVMRQFASAVLTNEQSGGSLSRILRHQAQQARSQLAMEIERQAQEAPVKLLAPLMLCIFPCTFLVLLAPLSVRLMDFLV